MAVSRYVQASVSVRRMSYQSSTDLRSRRAVPTRSPTRSESTPPTQLPQPRVVNLVTATRRYHSTRRRPVLLLTEQGQRGRLVKRTD